MEKKLTENLEQEKKHIPNKIYDTSKKEDLKDLKENLASIYFNPEVDKTYKIEITTTQVEEVEKEFKKDGVVENLIKYVIGIKATNKENEEFIGIWEVGRGVLNSMLKNEFEVGTVFKITKTGTGLNTKYNVIKDF